MWASSRIAWSEFRIGFSRRSTGAPGVRDFVALAAFFGLMMFLILLGWSVRDGLWGRIEQILLGALPEGQVPIRLGYHIDNTSKVNVNIIDEFARRFPYLELVPQRSSDGEKGAVILPGLKVDVDPSGKILGIEGPWGPGKKDKRITPFRIDAIPFGTPLWDWISRSDKHAQSKAAHGSDSPRAAGSMRLAASRHLFEQHFQYDVYRRSILANRLVPCNLKHGLPERLSRIDDLRVLVLEIRENITSPDGTRATVPGYHAFDVTWVDSFPIPDQTAVVMPLSTFEILSVSAENQLVDLAPEALAEREAVRFSQLKLMDVDLERAGVPEFLSLAGCLGAVPASGTADDAGGNSCRNTAPPASNPEGVATLPAVLAVGCETLRDRMPLKYPRLVNNGQDLLICAGEHRRIRGRELAACTAASGLDAIRAAQPAVAARYESRAAPPVAAIEWLGPSRLGVPCRVMGEADFIMAKALARDRSAAGSQDGAAQGGSTADAEGEAWIAKCEQWKADHPAGGEGDPKAFIHLPGYNDVTIYVRQTPEEPLTLSRLREDLQTYLASSAIAQHDSQSLNLLTKELLSWTSRLAHPSDGAPAPVFSVDPGYESALVRFGVLSVIIEQASTPLALGGLALFVFLTSVILSTAIAHRRRQFGLLMMAGLGASKIAYIVSLQIMLSCVVGGLGGALACVATSALINRLLAASSMITEARYIIGLDVDSFLSPLTWPVILGLWAGMLFLAVLIGTALMRLQQITTATAPIQLLRS